MDSKPPTLSGNSSIGETWHPFERSCSPSLGWLLIPYVSFGIGMWALQNAFQALVIYHLGIIACLNANPKCWAWENVWEGFSWRGALLTVGGTFVAVLPLTLLGWMEGYTGAPVIRNLEAFGLQGWITPVFAAYFILINPPLEELFWRRLFFSGKKWIAWQDLAFGGFHFAILYPLFPLRYALAGVFMIAVIGWGWRLLARSSKGLNLAVLGHVAGDAAISLVTLILVFL